MRRAQCDRHDPVAVRSAHGQRVAQRRLAQPPLVLHAERHLAEPGPVDDGAAAAERAGLVEYVGHAAAGMPTTTASGASGSSASDGKHGTRAPTPRLGLTPHTGPAKPSRARLSSVSPA